MKSLTRFRFGAIAATLTLVLPLCLPGVAAVPAERPNLIVIVADDLGYGELGCYGGKDIPTPNLDRLAASGVRFSSGYVTAPMCAASRAGLLTGRYQTRFGFEFNPIGAENNDPAIGMPVTERTYADRLREAGYATALIGKWHLGGTARYHPQRRGFDTFFGFLHEGHSFVPPTRGGYVRWERRKALPNGSTGRWTSPDGLTIWTTHMGHFEPAYDADNPILQSGQPVDEQEDLTDAFTRESLAFIEQHRHQPFSLTLTYSAVHSPLQAELKHMEKFSRITDVQRRIFASLLDRMDAGVGRVLDKLREFGLAQRTMVVFISDNGGPTRELTSSNHPLRGQKLDLYEGGVRVPFIVSWPGQLRAGKVEDGIVSTLDLQPTLLAAAGAAHAKGDGANLLPWLRGETNAAPHDVLYWRVGRKAALRLGEWKLVRNANTEGAAWELYDLSRDLSEARDLGAEQPDRLKELITRWDKINSEMADPLWGGRK